MQPFWSILSKYKDCRKDKYVIMANFSRYIPYCFAFLLLSSCKNEVIEKPQAEKEIKEFDLDRIKEEGRLVALIDYSSTSYFIYRGTPMGFEYDLLNKFAKHLGVELTVKTIGNLDEVITALNDEEADLIAASLTVTRERLQEVNFSIPHTYTRQVLVQRKPHNWQQMSVPEMRKELITDPIDLGYKKVHLRRNSAFYTRLKNLSEEIGEPIYIEEVGGDISTEQLIEQVAKGEINFTIADQHIARVHAAHYDNLYIEIPISFKQQIAWALRKSSPKLLEEINEWLTTFKKTSEFAVIYNKYYNNKTIYKERITSEFYSSRSGKISVYDDLIKKYSSELNWDWKLLSSLIYQESNFRADVESWAGAYGLMQIMPETAERYGLDSNSTTEDHIRAGVQYLKWLDGKWRTSIENDRERIKFVLASYNVGLGHVIDARNLAIKYGKDPTVWDDNVAEFILKKSQPACYKDPVVRFGYCRGSEPYNYVREILKRYEQYETLIIAQAD